MSTRGTLHYWFGGAVHVYHDMLDNYVYVELFERFEIRLWKYGS